MSCDVVKFLLLKDSSPLVIVLVSQIIVRSMIGTRIEQVNSLQNLDSFHGGVVHSFTGTPEEAEELLSFENVYIGEINKLPKSSMLFFGLKSARFPFKP